MLDRCRKLRYTSGTVGRDSGAGHRAAEGSTVRGTVTLTSRLDKVGTVTQVTTQERLMKTVVVTIGGELWDIAKGFSNDVEALSYMLSLYDPFQNPRTPEDF